MCSMDLLQEDRYKQQAQFCLCAQSWTNAVDMIAMRLTAPDQKPQPELIFLLRFLL